MNNTLLRAEFERKFRLFAFFANALGITFITTSFLRSAEEQNKLFKQGRSLCDGYKKISKHQKGRAKDIVIIDEKGKLIWDHIPAYDILGRIWEQLGGTWGGDWYKEGKTTFDDPYHFDM